MKTLLKLLLAGMAALAMPVYAEGMLNSYTTVNIDAPASRIWDVVKDFDGLETWHPAFSDDVIKSGTNNQVGAIRTLTLQDGPSFDEELLEWNAEERTYTYRVIDPNPLPILEYESTLEVMQLRPGESIVTWRSSYRNNSNGQMSDDELIAFLNGVYKAGLDAVKAGLE